MPSPIGHAIAGAAVAWGGDALDRRRSSVRLVVVCALLGAAADLDLLLPRYHRSYSHSLVAAALVLIIAAVVTGRVTRWRTAFLCCAAYASHLLLDWLGADTLPPAGLQVFWPFVGRFFISGFDVFAEVERRHPFAPATILQNLRAAAQEIAIVAPVAIALWAVRVEALARLAPELPRGHHPAEEGTGSVLRIADSVVENVENR
jgi:inner membrane protein